MRKRKLFSILSGIANWYLLICVMGAVTAIISALTGYLLNDIVFISFLFFGTAGVIVYQIVSCRVKWVTPGEAVWGRVVTPNGHKEWQNPLCKSRLLYNVAIFLAFHIASNIWDNTFDGMIYPIWRVFFKVAITIYLWRSIMRAGQGDAAGLNYVAMYYMFAGIGFIVASGLGERFVDSPIFITGIVHFLLAAFTRGVVMYYQRKPEQHSAEGEATVGLDKV